MISASNNYNLVTSQSTFEECTLDDEVVSDCDTPVIPQNYILESQINKYLVPKNKFDQGIEQRRIRKKIDFGHTSGIQKTIQSQILQNKQPEEH